MATYAILGGTGGIGSALVARLAQKGHRVVIAARDESRLAAAVAATPDSRAFPCDATSFDQVADCLAAAREHGDGQLDGVALCVGSILLRPAHATSFEDWQNTIALNLTSAFAVVRAAAKTMRGGGSVVLCSSTAASVGLANHEAIAAAKAGVEGLVRAAAATNVARNLRFNAIAPGLVDTPMAEQLTGSDVALTASKRLHPLGRIGHPDEVASLMAWLLNGESSWMTGEVIAIDGGMSRVRVNR
ncbi:MAG: SDR family oxidoreductase [bacterium]|nr:SDR family oxidoreductase [bacterium]